MNIQWFPGHMTKSLRAMQASLKAIDFVIYMLDARAPSACINPAFDRLFGDMPIIYILNKVDIADGATLERFAKTIDTSKNAIITLNSTESRSTKSISKIAKSLCSDKINKYQAKGVRISLAGIVVGVPNVGKSTFINNMLGKKHARTGNKAGVTRSVQSIKIDEYLHIMDTPGTLYPKLDRQDIATRLAIIGSIKDEVLDINEIAAELLRMLTRDYLEILTQKYNIDDMDTLESSLSKIAVKRGYLGKGGTVDIHKASIAIVDDFRKGRLGKISLE